MPSDLAHVLASALRARRLRVPAMVDITALLDAAFAASLLYEEGEPVRLHVAWIDPDHPDPDPPPYIRASRWSWVPFVPPIELTPESLAKVAHASDPRASWLGVFGHKGQLAIHGLVDQLTLAHDFMNRDQEKVFPPPGSFQVRAIGAAHLSVLLGYAKVGELRQGALIGPSVDVFRRGVIRRRLSVGLDEYLGDVGKLVPKGDPLTRQEYVDRWLGSLCRLLIRAEAYRHGGAFVLAPDAATEGLNVKYRLQYSRLADALRRAAQEASVNRVAFEHILDTYLQPARKMMRTEDYLDASIADDELDDIRDELDGSTRFISLLSRVDGCVLMDLGLRVHGFGAEILVESPPSRVVRVVSPVGITRAAKSLDYLHFGTRHRSMMRYCWSVPGSVGFVISKDGGVRAITREGEALLVWDDIQLQHEWDIAGWRNPLVGATAMGSAVAPTTSGAARPRAS